jgi:aerobic-type carbon monoxide dehydrogenase small subunit (CoxS/CutS family)
MKSVALTINGIRQIVPEGTTVGALLHHLNVPLRSSARAGEPRSLFCGMGICFECAVRIDGRSDVRACVTMAAEGMIVETLT